MKGLLFSLALLLSFPISAQIYIGKGVKIADGDTFTLLLSDSSTKKIRLHGIDCPERGQDFGRVATEFARDFMTDRVLVVKQTDIDHYGRTVGIVYSPDRRRSLNEELLKNGLAWHYKQYDGQRRWARLEERARKKKTGLWSMENPVEPAVYRKSKRAKTPVSAL